MTWGTKSMHSKVQIIYKYQKIQPTQAPKETTTAPATTNSKSNKKQEAKETEEGNSNQKVKEEKMESFKRQRKT